MNKLRGLLLERNLTQTELARVMKRDKSVVTNLLKGKRQLKAEEAIRIAEYLGVPVSTLLETKEKPVDGMEESALIPFQMAQKSRHRQTGNIRRKQGKYYLQNIGMMPEKAYALEVSDDSMNLSGILPGDIVISELGKRIQSEDIVVVQHYKGTGATTILRKYAPPLLLPHSTNSSHQPLSEEDENVRMVSPVIRVMRLL